MGRFRVFGVKRLVEWLGDDAVETEVGSAKAMQVIYIATMAQWVILMSVARLWSDSYLENRKIQSFTNIFFDKLYAQPASPNEGTLDICLADLR